MTEPIIKRERELDDVKQEVDLTVEKRIQENSATTREQAKNKESNLIFVVLI